MKKLELTFFSNGAVVQNVAFTVSQSDRVLVEDCISGKISSTFKRVYEVDADESHIDLFLHNDHDSSLTAIASLS